MMKGYLPQQSQNENRILHLVRNQRGIKGANSISVISMCGANFMSQAFEYANDDALCT